MTSTSGLLVLSEFLSLNLHSPTEALVSAEENDFHSLQVQVTLLTAILMRAAIKEDLGGNGRKGTWAKSPKILKAIMSHARSNDATPVDADLRNILSCRCLYQLVKQSSGYLLSINHLDSHCQAQFCFLHDVMLSGVVNSGLTCRIVIWIARTWCRPSFSRHPPPNLLSLAAIHSSNRGQKQRNWSRIPVLGFQKGWVTTKRRTTPRSCNPDDCMACQSRINHARQHHIMQKAELSLTLAIQIIN